MNIVTLITNIVMMMCTYNTSLAQTTENSWIRKQTNTSGVDMILDEPSASLPRLPSTTPTPAVNQPQPSVSKETYDRIMSTMDVFNVVFEGVSIVLTFTSASIYALPNMRCATATYLVALNAADTLSGFLVVIRNIWKAVEGPLATTREDYHYFTIFVSVYLTVSLRRMVYSLTAMVSLERFFVIAFPMKARHTKLVRYPRLSTAGICLAVLVMHMYLPLKYKVAPSSRGTGYSMINSEAYKANEATFDDVSNVAKIMFAYFPLCLCLLLSVLLMVALKRHAGSRQALQEHKDDGKAAETRSAERQLAFTIWLSSFLFTLLSLPNNTSQVVSTYHSTFRFMGLEHYLYQIVGRFTYVALIASRYTNFLAYLGLSTAFRRNLIRILCPKKVVHRLLRGTRRSDRQTGNATAEMSQTVVFTITSI